jgi:hypothetical protein
VAEDRCSAEPRAANKFARSIESLRGAPIQLAADDLCRTHDAGGAGAWTCRKSNPSCRAA